MNDKASGAWPPLPPTWPETTRRHDPKRRFRVAALLVGLLVVGYLTNTRVFGSRPHSPAKPPPPASVTADPMNPWDSINPSPTLTWHPCYTPLNPNFLCARLTVPMDPSRPLNSNPNPLSPNSDDVPKVHVALLLLPAAQNQTGTSNAPLTPGGKQPLLVNPGGPGGSGVLVTLMLAASMQKILGADQPVLGFDPRGVAFTTPRADCWAVPGVCDDAAASGGCEEDDVAGGLMHRLEWERVNAAYGFFGHGEESMRFLEVGQRGVTAMCRQRGGKEGSILRWAGTREVARDMLAIVDAWESWVDAEAEERGVMRDGDEEMRGKLVYWGFSYGTYLGATFAKMFPERVGRLMLDGVVDAELYETPMWKGSLVDADRVLGSFFRYCVEAGRRCDLYREGDRPEDVQKRYDSVMERLQTDPVTFTHPDLFFPVVLRHSLVKMIVFQVLYQPIQGFPLLATILDKIYEGQAEQLSLLFPDAQLLCTIAGNPMLADVMTDAQRAIMCSDKTEPVNMTHSELVSTYKDLSATSQFADIWMSILMKCNGWDIAPPLSDPWAASSQNGPSGQTKQIETANPILFLSNTYDPVTPLRAAVKMALKFKGAGLLEQLSQGHCTLAAVSRCTARAVREYLVNGKLPPPPTKVDDGFLEGEWTQCEVDETPWGKVSAAEVGTWAVEERKMVEGWQEVQSAMTQVQKWGVGKGEGVDMEAVMALARPRK